MSYLLAGTVLYGLIFSFCYIGVIREPLAAPETNKSSLPVVCTGLAAVFVLQLIVSGLAPGHVQDTALFRSWAAFANEHPIWEYYTTDLYVDYPPVYLYILYAVGKLSAFFGVMPDSPMYLVCIRSIPVFFDGLTSLCLYLSARGAVGEKKAAAVALLAAVNPANILNSSVWGQVDSVTAFMTAAMLLLLYKNRHVAACSFLALLFLTKPQTIIFAPLVAFVFFFDLWAVRNDTKKLKKLAGRAALALCAMAAVLLLVPLPITGGRYSLLIETYRNALGLYPYATLNAANLYGALGANWAQDGETLFIFSYKTWGFIFIVAISLCVGWGAWKSRDRRKILYLGVFTVLGIYMLAHGMHERYLHTALLLLLLIYIVTKDSDMLLFYGAFSLSTFLGCGAVLLQNLHDDFIYGDNMLFRLLSVIHLILFGLWIWHVLPFFGGKRAGRRHRPKAALRTGANGVPLQKTPVSAKFRPLDYWLMIGLTVFYALFGFYQLGSRSVPESGWYAETAGESVVLDVGEVQNVRQLYLYTGWIDRRQSDQEVCRELTVEYSADTQAWVAAETPMTLDSVFMWHVFRDFPDACRYLRLTCDDGRFYANEIALFGETEADRIAIINVESDNPTAACVIDEPERVSYEFTWYETAYFDEIYHPRTAFEFITHRYPYENTHPPLGKVIIACGMLLFGVNPFGWRFFGTLCGVLMVPLVYTMGKKMLKQTRYAFMAAFVFSFDFMHLSQTRLATIDSYTAFFVMGMYLFMFLYLEKSFYTEGVKKTLPPLCASGLCFGLGAATKWQGIYAGFGLALLFFYSLYRRYAEYKAAKQFPEQAGAARIVQTFWPRARQTVLAGLAFFVLMPSVIYFLSYIPAMMSESTGLSFFFTNQGSMFNYHAYLEAPHSYGSAWWQWPFDYKPLYAYSPNRDFVPEGTSMGITSFGNPALWWLTIPLVVWGVRRIVRQRHETDPGLLTAVAGFFSLYVPWIFVTRTAFIYHFFPCVVFVVLLLMFFFKEKQQDIRWRRLEGIYMAVVFVLFIVFYPVLTGMAVPAAYAEALRWIPGWVLG